MDDKDQRGKASCTVALAMRFDVAVMVTAEVDAPILAAPVPVEVEVEAVVSGSRLRRRLRLGNRGPLGINRSSRSRAISADACKTYRNDIDHVSRCLQRP